MASAKATQEISTKDTSTQPSSSTTTSTTDNNMAAVMAATRLSPDLSPLQTSHLHHSSSPPHSPSSPSSLSRKRSRSPLSIDLSSLPPLSSPAPPSNTLLITRLTDQRIFHPASLATIREHLTSIAPLNSFSPLKSMSRIIVSFHDETAAIKARQEIDGTAFGQNCIAKCYFGEPTPIMDGNFEKKYLDKPDAGRLFFISPPPSPPVGWEMKMEDPPNKEVHADDLATKLAKLTGRMAENPDSPTETSSPQQQQQQQVTAEELVRMRQTSPHRRALSAVSDDGTPKMRSRSSTLIYDPKAHGDSPALPAVMLETEDDSDIELDTDSTKGPMAHTSRPPVELMDQ